MEYLFLQIVLILFAARFFGEVVARFKVPSVIGEVLAGVIIGPSVLGWVEMNPAIQLLAQVGIILLLFEVGLETSISKLISSGAKASLVAIAGMAFPAILGFSASYYLLGLTSIVSIFIGTTLTATSIGVTLRVLHALKKKTAPETPVIIGAAVLDDILGLVILSMLYEYAKNGALNWVSAAKVASYIVLFMVISPFFARMVSAAIRKWHERSDIPGLLPTIIVSFILLFSWAAHMLGAPELLGGFAAGLALSRQFFLPFGSFIRQGSLHFGKRVEEEMRPIIHLFTPVFFVAIGLLLDSSTIYWLTGLLFIAAVLGKIFSGFLLKNEPKRSQIAIGCAMVPRGEVGLIFAKVGLAVGILQNDTYAAAILVIILTTIFAPFALKYVYSRSERSWARY
jgi:Kef-type K+ transport system membrane component KefB